MQTKDHTVVVSQPMYFPWIGIFQQIQSCNDFVFYDDVQFTRGFFNRVQLKTKDGIVWLTVPLIKWHRGQRICDIQVDNSKDWHVQHTNMLYQAFQHSHYRDDALDIVHSVFSKKTDSLSELSILSTRMMCQYLGLQGGNKRFMSSSSLSIDGQATDRLVSICQQLDANIYLTGHGAKHYLVHEQFKQCGMEVNYIDYALSPYPQQHGAFTPYVTALDAIANLGPKAVMLLPAAQMCWEKFMEQTKMEQRII